MIMLCFINLYIVLASTYGRSIWMREIDDPLSGENNKSSDIPDKFYLYQNYPNPFNPVTKIQYEIPKTGFVKLIAFDALGRKIETLVNEQLQPGTYEVNFDGSMLNSGVYFYKLISGDFTETKKMLLIK